MFAYKRYRLFANLCEVINHSLDCELLSKRNFCAAVFDFKQYVF